MTGFFHCSALLTIITDKMVVFMSINATGDYTCNQTDSIDMLGDSSFLPWFLSGKWSLTQILLLWMLYDKEPSQQMTTFLGKS